MKRAISLVLLTTMLFSTTGYARTVNLPYIFVNRVNEGWPEQESMYIRNECVFTGFDYLKVTSPNATRDLSANLHRSQDGVNWELIRAYSHDYVANEAQPETTRLIARLRSSPAFTHIINTGSGYIMRSRSNDWGFNDYNARGRVYVFDADLNSVKTSEFNRPIVQMSFVEGICYIVLYEPYVLMKSSDFENWEIVGENLGVPIVLGDRTIMRTFERQNHRTGRGAYYARQNPILYVNGMPAQKIDIEGIDFNSLQVVGGFFVASNSQLSYDENRNPSIQPRAFFYSKDGVYWAKQYLNHENGNNNIGNAITSIKESNGRLYVVKGQENEFYIFNLEDLEASVPRSDIYVEVNGEILGFETPPVIEDGRVLVPMRFTLEKMGVDVEWQAGQQTIVAQQQNMTVEMTIDNTASVVNGRSVRMDVPPRLINNRTMVPLRFLSEEMGFSVEWNAESNTAVITEN